MKDIIFDDFQNSVNDSLVRHKSILDLITKYSESSSRVNRAIAKSVTNCGCLTVNAKKQHLPDDEPIDNINNLMDTHLNGNLCDNCREVIEKEIGNNLFYLASLCNTLGINLYDVLLKEYDKIDTLGKFMLR